MSATIGDDLDPLYEFDWGDRVRTSDELGDLDVLDENITLEEIVEFGRADDDCEVRIIGFE